MRSRVHHLVRRLHWHIPSVSWVVHVVRRVLHVRWHSDTRGLLAIHVLLLSRVEALGILTLTGIGPIVLLSSVAKILA